MSSNKTRFAIVGLGHIAQEAVLPAFSHAHNCSLTALVSGDDEKLEKLGERYGVERTLGYERYDELLESGAVDAVYIAVPNKLHADYAVRAAHRGVHVLCEKPMATTEEECERMILAARSNDVRLMVAYRLHFERINLEVADLLRNGDIGEPRIFSSVLSQNVARGDVRLAPLEAGGGSVFDMGIYCINAARYLFGAEPTEVSARSHSGRDPRFVACDEMTSALLGFPDGRIAQFTSSFGAVRSGEYRVVATRGEVIVHNAYDYAKDMSYQVHTSTGGTRTLRMSRHDQFAPQLIYFSDCIRQHRDPEPGGLEGYADVRIIRAIHRAAKTGARVELEPIPDLRRPTLAQAMWSPPVDKPPEINVSPPSQ